MKKIIKPLTICIVFILSIAIVYFIASYQDRISNKNTVKNPVLIANGKPDFKGEYASEYTPIVKISYTSTGLVDEIVDQFSNEFIEVRKLDINNIVGDEAIINIVGDIIPHADLQAGAEINNGYTHALNNIKPYLKDGDINIINLETPISDSNSYEGLGTRFNASPLLLDSLKEVGFEVLLTANNHSIDQGDNGYIETIDNIINAKLKPLGSYKNISLNEKSGNIIKVKGIKIGFLNVTLLSNFEPQKSNLFNYINDPSKWYYEISKKSEKLKENGAEIIILIIHWGDEYHIYPRKDIYDLAQKLIKNDIDVIIGGHPHVIQPYQVVKDKDINKFISYSIGNFLSHQRGLPKYGLMNKIYIGRNINNKVVVGKIDPIVLKVDTDIREYINPNNQRAYTYVDYIIKGNVINEYNQYRCKNKKAINCP